MPTANGSETIAERLVRKRADLVRVRATIENAENNGQAFTVQGGVSVTQIAYERAQKRERELSAEIATLERRLAGSAVSTVIARTQTRID